MHGITLDRVRQKIIVPIFFRNMARFFIFLVGSYSHTHTHFTVVIKSLGWDVPRATGVTVIAKSVKGGVNA